jgi:hypothetical protein
MYYGNLETLKCMHKYFQDFPRSRYVLQDHHFIGLFWVLTRIRKSRPETLFHSISPHFFGSTHLYTHNTSGLPDGKTPYWEWGPSAEVATL